MRKAFAVVTIGLLTAMMLATVAMARGPRLDKASPKSAVGDEDKLLESGGWMKIMDEDGEFSPASMEKISIDRHAGRKTVTGNEDGLNLIVLLGNDFSKYKACEQTDNKPPFCAEWEETKEGILDEAKEKGLLEDGDSIEMLLPPHTR